MVYRNPEKQEMTETLKSNKEFAKLTQVKESRQNTFNIVSHQGPPRRIEAMLTAQKAEAKTQRPYNFVTNLSNEDHLNAPLLYDDEYTITRAGKPKEIRDKVGKKDRDFNIVNNSYYHHHDRRKKQEYDQFKSHTLEKYWATHDYDPIRGKFYDINKEQSFREQREVLSQVHGLSKSLRLAPSIQFSDGNCYDILNHTIHDNNKCQTVDNVAERSLHRMKRVEKEKNATEIGEIQSTIADKRRLAKVSYKRWEEGIDRGYDFIKNTVNGSDLPQPLPSRPATMWDRLSTMDSNSTLTGVNPPKTGLSGAYSGYNSRSSTALPATADMNTNRIRNLSGAGPQYTEASGSHREAFPDSPASFPESRNPNYSNSTKLKPMTAVGNSSPYTSARAATASAIERPPIQTSSNKTSSRGMNRPVPSLDLSRAEPGEKVSYVEPTGGALSLPVAMVRTGGLSGYRE